MIGGFIMTASQLVRDNVYIEAVRTTQVCEFISIINTIKTMGSFPKKDDLMYQLINVVEEYSRRDLMIHELRIIQETANEIADELHKVLTDLRNQGK
jgi:ABC-type bacteriocin/lantibiotic exporter with double-glycine peptidase domain